MSKTKLRKFDPANYLKTEKDMALYLDACFREGGDDPAFVTAALGDIARARGMSNLAGKTGMTRAGLYKALGKDGNPSFGAVLKIVRAMGLELHVSPQR
ncbi:MAG: putative addiction module antidote protein [Enhydrobacter sp.]|nr:putative addiction module antidote protein [Enhydrobacter sp.]